MMKKLIGASLMAATTMTGFPAAMAQEAGSRSEWRDSTNNTHHQRFTRDDNLSTERQTERYERRDDRRDEARPERLAQTENRRDWREERRDDRRDWRDDRRDDRRDWRDDRRDDRKDWRENRRENWREWNRSHYRDWNHDWRRDRRYDWNTYRHRYRNHYRVGRYYAPRGWHYGYNRFSVGIYLNGLLFSNRYWIDDPYRYRLPPAYGPLRWVRYYDDVLLVDVRNGYVVDVIYDFFW